MKPIQQLLLLFCLFASMVVGCSTDQSRGTVHGKVTLDGAPLANGLIKFIPTDGQTATADATIADGTFTVKMPVGEKRVSISAPKVVGKRKAYTTPDSPTVDVIEELLPARYNAQSELRFTVAAGDQDADFPLKSGS